MLATNIFDKNITTTLFKELYFLRWGIECKYKELKSNIEIEAFSGTKPITIKQDFYASIYLSMVASLIKTDADAAIENDNKHKTLKSEYQVNRNFILSEVLKKIEAYFREANIGNFIRKSLKDTFTNTPQPYL